MDGMKDWPEPIIRVQALSENCSAVIPERYVKPPEERPVLAEPAGHNLSIPVIDLAGLAGSPAECRAAMRAISDACRHWGFFQVVNHGVSPDLMAQVQEVWRCFFQLPMAEKEVYANDPKTYEGYGSRLGIEKGAILDWNDYFYLHLLPSSLKDHGKWPAVPSSCSREIIEDYSSEVMKLCELLMKLMSMTLGLDVGYLQEAFGGEDIGACMRVNYYPKCPQPDLTLGLSSHSDPGGLTVLLADHRVGGLQIRKGDAWVTVQPEPHAFVVNVGDQIQVLSNATYKSVEHRVMANAAEERLSIAFFYNPKSDLLLGPAAELVTPEKPPLYQPMTFNEYRMYIRKKGPSGKTQVESLKINV